MGVWTPVTFGEKLMAGADAMPTLISEVIDSVGMEVTQAAIDAAPISRESSTNHVPGTLRMSIGMKRTRATVNPAVDVKADTDYAIYPEQGTSTMPAQLFMHHALEAGQKVLAAQVAITVKSAI